MQNKVQHCRPSLTEAEQVHMLRLPATLLSEVLKQASKAGPTLRAEGHHVLALQCRSMLGSGTQHSDADTKCLADNL